MGLLSKANLLEQNKRLAFSNLINKYNLKLFAIFSNTSNSYKIINSLGFDGTSIINSSSTDDFWTGICKEENIIYFFDKDNINPLLQFFSFKIKDEIENISVAKINGTIIMICNNHIPDSFITDFKNVSFTENEIDINSLNTLINKDSLVYKVSMDFEEAIDTYLLTKAKNIPNPETFKNSLSLELINRVFCFYNDSNASAKISDFSLNSLFICEKYTSQDLLLNHLVLNFKEVLDNTAELINLSFDGSAESFQDLKEFLQVK